MMIKNNIGNILLVLFAFLGTYIGFSYIDAQDKQREEKNVVKYKEAQLIPKSANLDTVQILPGTVIKQDNILTNGDILDEYVEGEDGEPVLKGNLTNIPETSDTKKIGGIQTNSDVLTSSGGIISEENIVNNKNDEDVINSIQETDVITEASNTGTGSAQNIVQKNILGIYNGETSYEKDLELSDTKKTFPASLNTSMNFHSQSPFGTWGEIFGETCEEASILLAYLYFEGITVTAQEFRDELLRLVDYQKEIFGDYKHTTVVQTAEMLRDYYNYDNFYILENPTPDDIKYNIAKGSVVLAPFYGVGLNPYYTGRGPEYHFMVLKGYTENTFIAHDVGTRRGENYEYKIDTIMDRIHDYNPESVQLGAKRVIVVSPR